MRMIHRIRQSPALLFSLALHAVLFCFLFVNMSKPSQPLIVNKGEKIVHATAIESTQIEAIDKQLKENKIQQQQAEIAQQKKIENQAKQAEAKRESEQKAAEMLKQQHELEVKKAEQQKIDDAKAVEELKTQQAVEKKKLAKLEEDKKIAAEKLKLKKIKDAEEAAKLAEKKAADAEKLKKQKDAEALKLKQKQQYDAAAALQKTIAAKQAAIAQQRSEAINGVVDQYKGLILEAISKNWLVPPGTDPSLACQLVITLGSAGKVTNVQVVKSSGNALLDQSAVAAVYKASPLPVPGDSDAAAIFKQFSLTLKPEQFVE